MTPDELRAMDCRVHEAMHPDQEIVASPISETMCYEDARYSYPVVIPLYTRDPACIEPLMRWLDARVDYPVCLFLDGDEWSVLSNTEPTANLALCRAVLAVGGKESEESKPARGEKVVVNFVEGGYREPRIVDDPTV